jgi:hypothetical protein
VFSAPGGFYSIRVCLVGEVASWGQDVSVRRGKLQGVVCEQSLNFGVATIAAQTGGADTRAKWAFRGRERYRSQVVLAAEALALEATGNRGSAT